MRRRAFVEVLSNDELRITTTFKQKYIKIPLGISMIDLINLKATDKDRNSKFFAIMERNKDHIIGVACGYDGGNIVELGTFSLGSDELPNKLNMLTKTVVI